MLTPAPEGPVRGGDSPLTFANHDDLVCAHPWYSIDRAARPCDFHNVRFLMLAQAKMQPHIVAREEAAPGSHAIVLGDFVRHHLDQGANAVAIAFGPNGLNLKLVPVPI